MSELTTAAPALDLPAHDTTTTGLVLDGRNMDSMMRAAELMAGGRATVPKHLQGSPADCMAVIMQAMQWGMNPFVVAQKTHIVNGQLGYEAQLVNAVLQASGAIKGRFHYEYRGEGGALECRAGAVPAGETELVWTEWLKSSDVQVKNSPLWKTNPKQQIGYLQVKNWARAFKPGAILGVYTTDELQDSPPMERDITPRTAAEFAEAAKPLPTTNVDRKQVIRDLEMIARSDDPATQRIAELEAAWKGLTKDERVAVGAEEIKRLQSIAAVEDATQVDAQERPSGATAGDSGASSYEEVRG
ncbi:RecT family recombinase [Bordetella trematum]|uniref:RecT family recombinase n=1 Tax=Bordetella trematum TaxID=123899 RepID=UPI000D910BBB|nr:RecT family recombinase [Bordetella trematum]SPU49872.1 RecT family [Bordetella trematum]VDH07616.1 RecT family [Bordetella trematum]